MHVDRFSASPFTNGGVRRREGGCLLRGWGYCKSNWVTGASVSLVLYNHDDSMNPCKGFDPHLYNEARIKEGDGYAMILYEDSNYCKQAHQPC